MIEAYPEIKFHFTSEFKREMQEADPAGRSGPHPIIDRACMAYAH